MNHKQKLKISLFFILIILIGCEHGTNSKENLSQNDYTSADLYLVGFEDAMSAIEDATIDTDMRFASFFDRTDFPPKADFAFGHKHGDRVGFRNGFKGRGLHLGLVFFRLNLNELQRELIKEAMIANRECLAEPFQQFREAAKVIMDDVKDERKAIYELFRNGELSREEARTKIHELNLIVREDIKNSPDCIAAADAICECNNNFMTNIGSFLEEEQLFIWEQWLDEHPTPCSGG